jgi:hypothetical protein
MSSDMDCEEWLVQLASGDVRIMTLDELDAAFQSGTVDENTLVRHDGAKKWSKLADVLAETPEPAHASAPPPSAQASASQPAVVITRSEAPVAVDLSLPDLHAAHADVDFEAVHRATRKRRLIAGGVVATAIIGAFAAVTAVNVARMQKHAALVADLAATPRLEAPSDPEPQDTPKAKDDSKKRDKNVRRQRSQGAGQQQQPGSDLKNTPFQNGGDEHDPLNGKL